MTNSLAALKKRLTLGIGITMVGHDWFPEGKLIGVPRYVVKVQANGICLNADSNAIDGSWLYWPKARDLAFTETGFSVALNDDPVPPRMYYVYID